MKRIYILSLSPASTTTTTEEGSGDDSDIPLIFEERFPETQEGDIYLPEGFIPLN